LPKEHEPAGASWRDVARWFWELLGPAIKSLVGPLVGSAGVYVIAGKDFVWSSHSVPGWALVGFAGVAGLCVASVGAHLYRWLHAKRGGLLAVEHTGPHALRWQMGKRGDVPIMMPCGDFYITSLSSANVAVPRSVLLVGYRRWGVLPASRRVDGAGVFETLKGHGARKERLIWHIEPPVLREGEVLRAKICLIDHLGGENWTGWLRWPYV